MEKDGIFSDILPMSNLVKNPLGKIIEIHLKGLLKLLLVLIFE